MKKLVLTLSIFVLAGSVSASYFAINSTKISVNSGEEDGEKGEKKCCKSKKNKKACAGEVAVMEGQEKKTCTKGEKKSCCKKKSENLVPVEN